MAKDEIITCKKITKPVLLMLHILGCNPMKRTIRGKITFWAYVAAATIFSLGSITRCIQESTLVEFSISYVDFLAINQGLAKTMCIFLMHKTAARLLQRMWDEFWPVDKTPHLLQKYNKSYRTIARGSRLYGCIMFLCVTLFSIRGIMTSPKTLPYNIYLLGYENSTLVTTPYYEFFYAFEIVSISAPFVLTLSGHDILFIIMCGCAITQLEMIKMQILTIGKDEQDEKKSFDILKECVDHHNMLLEFIRDLNSLITYSLLRQYVDNICCIGVYLYALQIDFSVSSVFGLGTCFYQALFFSIFGQAIQNRNDAIREAAYNNHWHLVNSRRLHQGLLLVILRAQRQVKLSAGGFFNLSFESFVAIVRAAGSFVAFLNSTRDK